MPSIDKNLAAWDNEKRWEDDGERWSSNWGNSHAMWFGSILPRIASFLPADHLLEIACGRGRVSAFLLGQCARYDGVDLAPSCVEFCRERFQGVEHARFHQTDGTSLAMVEDDSIDFAFSWDSLVHVDSTVLDAYVGQLAKKLRVGGVAFLHHSNLGSFVGDDGELTVDNPHWRDPGVSAASFRALLEKHGLTCRVQELVQWGVDHRNDCFSLFHRPAAGEPAREPLLYEHPAMSSETGHFRTIDGLYRGGEVR